MGKPFRLMAHAHHGLSQPHPIEVLQSGLPVTFFRTSTQRGAETWIVVPSAYCRRLLPTSSSQNGALIGEPNICSDAIQESDDIRLQRNDLHGRKQFKCLLPLAVLHFWPRRLCKKILCSLSVAYLFPRSKSVVLFACIDDAVATDGILRLSQARIHPKQANAQTPVEQFIPTTQMDLLCIVLTVQKTGCTSWRVMVLSKSSARCQSCNQATRKAQGEDWNYWWDLERK